MVFFYHLCQKLYHIVIILICLVEIKYRICYNIVYDNKIKKTSEEVDFSTPVQSALPTI